MSYRILTKNGVDNTNIDGARNYNFNAGRRSGIVKGALNQGNFFVSSSGSNVGHTVILDTCEIRLCGHRVVIDEATYWSFHDLPQTPQRYSLIAQVIVDNSENVTFDLFLQSVDTPLIQDNLDKTGTGTYQLEIGRYTQQTDGTITDVVRTADLITGGVGDDDAGEVINIGNVKTNTLDAGMEAEVDIENRYSEEEKKTYTDFTFSIPKGDQGIHGLQGEKGDTGATGNGIISISKTGTSKLVDTYTISFTSGETTTFQVTNGKGITKIEKTATSGLVDTYTITFNDTTTNTFQVTNGAKGDKGDKGDTGVTPNITATATTLPAGSSATVTKSGTAENPTSDFGIPKGDKGDKGEKGESGTVVSVAGEEKTSINTDTTPTANSQNLVTSGGVHDYPAVTFAESERQKSITDGAIVHEKEIADVEHIETIYDMSSSNANINKGYTSGISGNTTIQNLNFSKYKRLKIYSRDYWGTVGIGEIDFSVISMYGNFYSGMASIGNRYYNDDNGDIFTEMVYFHRYKVNSSKTTFNLIVERRSWTNQPSCSGEMISDTDNIVYKIEGVY